MTTILCILGAILLGVFIAISIIQFSKHGSIHIQIDIDDDQR